MEKVVTKIGKFGKYYTGFDFLYKALYKNEKDANEAYKKIYPAMKATIRAHGVSSEKAQGILELLASYAPTGAKKRNFTRYYINDPEGWKKLPKDPNDIPYGRWY
ncbi:hypothetical protein DXX93_08620 [Thalassotalea euphylliae]|uniref:Uncharacterized protein n=1 Tax=Thalassotalea euphylliae TaxID=1655234 RepID=A0A3E0TQ28_9GAMM|nr:hypothetical protein [Thalassotalea euphylliae]REL26634.1 hypothetical protein DXX93_08620 [Thalassotalea euphylliae]